MRSGKVGQPLGHLLSLVTPSALDASFSELGEPERCHQQKRGPLGRSQEALECLAHPRGRSGQPRGSGHWRPLAWWHQASDPKESHPARSGQGQGHRHWAVILDSGACKQSQDLGAQ